MATFTTTAFGPTANQSVQSSNFVTSFHWDTEDIVTRLSYVDNRSNFRIGSRFAWYPTDYFEEHIWRNFLYPKLENVFNKNQKEIFGSRSKPFSEIKCYMTSTSAEWTDSRPTVVASSTKPKIAHNITSVFTRNPIISRLKTGFDFFADPDEADSEITATRTELSPPVFSTSASSLCGIRILIAPQPGDNSSAWKHATLGGLIRIDGVIYGLTAAHVFSSNTKTEDDSSEDGQSEQSETSQTSIAPRISHDLLSSSRTHSASTVYIDGAKYTRLIDADGHREIIGNGDSVNRDLANVLGELHQTESAGTWLNVNKDWALIKIPDPSYHLPNTVRLDESIIECSSIATEIPYGKVAVAAGFGGVGVAESPGRTRGVLLPGAPEMISMFTIEGSSLPGDCGSWVIDLAMGQVYGMLLASSARQNCSYCLSMSEIFDSIRSTLGVSTPMISWSEEHHLGQNGPPRFDSTNDIPLPPNSNAPGNLVDLESSPGEPFVTASHDQVNVDKPSEGPEFSTTTTNTPEAHPSRPDISDFEPLFQETQSAYDPNARKLIWASKLGHFSGTSYWTTSTTKIDPSVVKDMGYKMWQGEASIIIETHDKEVSELHAVWQGEVIASAAAGTVTLTMSKFEFSKLLQRNAHSSHPLNASVESISEEENKKLFSATSTTAIENEVSVSGNQEHIDERNVDQKAIIPRQASLENLLEFVSRPGRSVNEPTVERDEIVTRRADSDERKSAARRDLLEKSDYDDRRDERGREEIIRRDQPYDRRPYRSTDRRNDDEIVIIPDGVERQVITIRRSFRSPSPPSPPLPPLREYEEIVTRRDERDERERERDEVVIRRDEREPSRERYRQVEREEIIIRRDERERPYERVIRERDLDHEELAFRKDSDNETRAKYRQLEGVRPLNVLSVEEQRLLGEEQGSRREEYSRRRGPNPNTKTNYRYGEDDRDPAYTLKEEADELGGWLTMRIPPGTANVKYTMKDGYDEFDWQDSNGLQQSAYFRSTARHIPVHGDTPFIQPPVYEPANRGATDDTFIGSTPLLTYAPEYNADNEAEERRPKKGTTKLPKELFSTKVLARLGYDYQEMDDKTILVKQALHSDDIREIMLLSRRPFSTNAAKEDKSEMNTQLPQLLPPRRNQIQECHRKQLDEFGRLEKRLWFKSQIQQVFLEGGLTATTMVERIMKYFDEQVDQPLEDPFAYVVEEEDSGVSKPTTDNRKHHSKDENRTGYEFRDLARHYDDDIVNEEPITVASEERSGRHVGFREPDRLKQPQNRRPGSLSNEDLDNVRVALAEDYKHLERNYRASALARGASIKQIDTILNKLWKIHSTDQERLKALKGLLESSSAKEQKATSLVNLPGALSNRQSPGRGILRRKSSLESFDRRPRRRPGVTLHHEDSELSRRGRREGSEAEKEMREVKFRR